MKAYSKNITKEQFVNELQLHKSLDNFIQGTYQSERGKGCAVGCGIMSINKLKGLNKNVNDHKVFEEELGIPEWLARVQDIIFEGLSKKDSKQWPLYFAESIIPGSDLNKIKIPFICFILEKNIETQEDLLSRTEAKDIIEIIKNVIEVNKTMIKAQINGEREYIKEAESAAWSAARSAAESAAWSAESASRSAAESAAWSAESASRSAAESAAWSAESASRSAAESAACFKLYADKLINLIKKCK